MRTPPLVLYHANCYDGFTAAWVLARHVPDAEFAPVQYGDKNRPVCKGREVYVLDFSFKREIMKQVIVESQKTIILDHHRTAEAELTGIMQEIRNDGVQRGGADKIVFDMNRSGAGITFDYFEAIADKKRGFKLPRHNEARASWLVDSVEDRDIWRFALKGTAEVTAYLGSQPMTFESWNAIEKSGLDAAIMAGGYIMAYIEQYGEKACAMAKVEVIDGHEVPTMTLPYMNCSEHVTRLLEKYQGASFAAGYFRRADGLWQFSLRSRSDFDVSEVAKKYGGGGHAQAAGFETSLLPWGAGMAEDAGEPIVVSY